MKFFNSLIFLFCLFQNLYFFALSEFYFVRHGQTDFNSGKQKKYKDIFMNQKGKKEIKELKKMMKDLPIEVIYFSPLKRTVETKNILNQLFNVPAVRLSEIEEIRTKFLVERSNNKLDKISKGLNKVLADSRLVLVVGHSNIYKAICYLLDIKTDISGIDTGSLVHFYQKADGAWTVDLLADLSRGYA